MRWSRRWGHYFKVVTDPRTRQQTFWGGEDQYKTGRLEVRNIRGRIIPCDSCRRVSTCAMYQSATRHRLHGEYSHGTNIIHMCDIYLPSDAPSSVQKTPDIHGRTSGKEPT
jgi:hypothetical protein